MSAKPSVQKPASNGTRAALGIGGVLAVIIGVLILAWPGKTAAVVTAIIGIYALTAGLVYVCLGFFAADKGARPRIGHVVLGALFIAAGTSALLNLGQTTAWLALFVGVLVGALWVVEGVVALASLRSATSKGWTILFAILSIVAGIVLLFSPLYVAWLWWLLGVSMVVLGVTNGVRAFRLGKKGL